MATTSKALPDVLFDFVTNNQNYKQLHARIPNTESAQLEKCLFATLDEVRLYAADKYAKGVLRLTDLEDAAHFRQGVLRRESSRDVSYDKQRDHAAHTLHNYLLGWYIYENNPGFKLTMNKAIRERYFPKDLQSQDKQSKNAYYLKAFMGVWPYVSLLHDIGYLFEGGLDILSIDINSERVKRGAEVVQEYFHHRFWIETPMAAVTERAKIKKLVQIEEPNFAPYHISSVGDTLRTLGNLETLWRCAMEELTNESVVKLDELKELDFGGVGDAFEVWKKHYKIYNPYMMERIERLQSAYYALMWEGIPGVGVRVLDHGVAGGLLQLLYATYYFRMHYGIMSAKPSNSLTVDELSGLQRRIKQRTRAGGFMHTAHWWWTSAVWATAATALHNLQQELQWPGVETPNDPLALEEDPLAYLGILVDILEEWDRYTVSRASIFTGKLPLQAKDVMLDTEKGRIRIKYDNLKRANKVREALDIALLDWDNIVLVLPSPPS